MALCVSARVCGLCKNIAFQTESSNSTILDLVTLNNFRAIHIVWEFFERNNKKQGGRERGLKTGRDPSKTKVLAGKVGGALWL